MIEDTLFPFDLPIVARKKVTAAFDGGRITSNAGVMLLAQAGRRLGIAGQLARVIPDERHAGRVIHLLPDILRGRIFAIACGYEDADDLDRLRVAPSRFFAVFADWSKASLTALRALSGRQVRRGRSRIRRQSTLGRKPEMPDTPTFGRYAEIPYNQMTPEQQEAYRSLIEIRGQVGGPSKIWVHNPKLAKAAAPLGAHFHPGHYSLTEREREIAVCIINSKWHSAYPTSAHERRGKEVGLPAEKVEALIAGLQTSFSDDREQVVYEMAMALANSRWVPQGLYDRAVKALGHVGITDVITLMGYYTSVSMTLAFYDVPAGAPGMAR
jgi:4-carboxymuconolactone decarboxylase